MSAVAEEVLKVARRRAHLTQRELARRSGVRQPTISRIESGRMSPTFDLLARLLAACGMELITADSPAPDDVDRTLIRDNLRLTPRERLDRAVSAWNNTRVFRGSKA